MCTFWEELLVSIGLSLYEPYLSINFSKSFQTLTENLGKHLFSHVYFAIACVDKCDYGTGNQGRFSQEMDAEPISFWTRYGKRYAFIFKKWEDVYER